MVDVASKIMVVPDAITNEVNKIVLNVLLFFSGFNLVVANTQIVTLYNYLL